MLMNTQQKVFENLFVFNEFDYDKFTSASISNFFEAAPLVYIFNSMDVPDFNHLTNR